jgi:hypothetical protein
MIAAWLLATSCGTARTAPPPILPPAGDTGLVVRLAWSVSVDLDLYVTTPRGETIYYGNPGPFFVADARCDAAIARPRVEEVRWRSPAPGRYRVGVDFPETCADELDAAVYRIVVDLAGRRHAEHTGTVRRLVREPVVLELDVP